MKYNKEGRTLSRLHDKSHSLTKWLISSSLLKSTGQIPNIQYWNTETGCSELFRLSKKHSS